MNNYIYLVTNNGKIYIFCPDQYFEDSNTFQRKARAVFHGTFTDVKHLEEKDLVGNNLEKTLAPNLDRIIIFSDDVETIGVGGWNDLQKQWIQDRPSVELIATLLVTTQS